MKEEVKKVSFADRGWIRQEMNEMAAGKKGHLRNPLGKDLARERGRENAKGYGYEHSHLQNRKDHRSQHKLDNWGCNNKERPVRLLLTQNKLKLYELLHIEGSSYKSNV